MPRKARREPPGKLHRRTATREPRPTCLIVCGGQTEQQYFEALRKALRLGAAVVVACEALSPSGIVDKVADRESWDVPYDHVWAVFDRDNFVDFEALVTNGRKRPGVTRTTSPWPAAGKSQNGGEWIGLAWSNPCFELWLLLHRQEWTRECSGKEVEAALKAHPGFEGYEHGTTVFARIDDTRQVAIERAAALAERLDRDGRRCFDCPSTTVHDLICLLEQLARQVAG